MVDRIHFVFLSIGHLYDHLFMLVFATVAALSLSHEWGMSYAELIPYATPGFGHPAPYQYGKPLQPTGLFPELMDKCECASSCVGLCLSFLDSLFSSDPPLF